VLLRFTLHIFDPSTVYSNPFHVLSFQVSHGEAYEALITLGTALLMNFPNVILSLTNMSDGESVCLNEGYVPVGLTNL